MRRTKATGPGGPRVPQFPPDDPSKEYEGKNTRLRRELWERLARIAKSEGKSRSYVIEYFLTWAADDYETGKAKSKKQG